VFTDTFQTADVSFKHGQAFVDYRSRHGWVYHFTPVILVRDNIGENIGGDLIEECAPVCPERLHLPTHPPVRPCGRLLGTRHQDGVLCHGLCWFPALHVAMGNCCYHFCEQHYCLLVFGGAAMGAAASASAWGTVCGLFNRHALGMCSPGDACT
jgi:hypothetical protein